MQILTEPKNALVKQYQRLFEMENVDLTFPEEALGAIAKQGDRAQDRRARPALDHGGHPARHHVRPAEPRRRRGGGDLAAKWSRAAPGRSTSTPTAQRPQRRRRRCERLTWNRGAARRRFGCAMPRARVGTWRISLEYRAYLTRCRRIATYSANGMRRDVVAYPGRVSYSPSGADSRRPRSLPGPPALRRDCASAGRGGGAQQ